MLTMHTLTSSSNALSLSPVIPIAAKNYNIKHLVSTFSTLIVHRKEKEKRTSSASSPRSSRGGGGSYSASSGCTMTGCGEEGDGRPNVFVCWCLGVTRRGEGIDPGICSSSSSSSRSRAGYVAVSA